jgi:hypothetical protein
MDPCGDFVRVDSYGVLSRDTGVYAGMHTCQNRSTCLARSVAVSHDADDVCACASAVRIAPGRHMALSMHCSIVCWW